MKILQFPNGPIESNCYLIETDNALILIDPSVPMSVLPEFKKPMKAIIITHCHYDHISCLDEIREKTKAPVYCHPTEFPAFADVVRNASTFFMMDKKYSVPDHKAEEGDILEIDARTTLRFLHTPGHTLGSICILLSEDKKDIALFTGDTLFQGSAGRTDLGGSPILLKQSLLRLRQLDNSILVYSGHGPNTTIGEEKQNNPFM